ncbi:flavin-containing amine oxidoreductase-domain containing protein [Aspergillus bertholletiae]|uniref:Flavin-containing amine oxidoreductase-domain containing protein n=1 Tax=Aspergillus bertholletiae TaxID=1226010 RepID=A0A5N7BC64_9EURO|nr:flavin-containing amine oxidoreductase-domain containing protein [Aspergillus bertholletiae]
MPESLPRHGNDHDMYRNHSGDPRRWDGRYHSSTLSNASIHDFAILEYRNTIGGRVWSTDFGQDKHGEPYVIEFGANWRSYMASGQVEQAHKHGLKNTPDNVSSVLTYDETGYNDYQHLLDAFGDLKSIAFRAAGQMLLDNIQDSNARTGFAMAGWNPPRNDMKAQAVEWWDWASPEASSFIFGVAAENLTFNQFGEDNHMVVDPRGYSTIIEREASTFLHKEVQDRRLWLNTQVTDIEYSRNGVKITNNDGSCITAAYAICTFSLGVLQNDVVQFHPALPTWKQTAIQKFSMGTYTKIFLQFDETFWPSDTQFFLYASPNTRGYYPIFQSLSKHDFMPGSNILFVTVVDEQAYRVERQPDEQTKEEILSVLREMFPEKHISDPTAFVYPRWSYEPWAYGSYSNWPVGTTLEMHQNLRANVDRLWFAGEATSAAYFGFLHGAWFEGREAGQQIAAMLQDECAHASNDVACGDRTHYDVLHGTTPIDAYTGINGWPVNSTDL